MDAARANSFPDNEFSLDELEPSATSRVLRSRETGLELAPGYEKLRHDFNAAVGTLREAMTLVAANAGAIRSGTSEIASAAQDLARRTEQQAATLEETAAALDQISTTVGKIGRAHV